MDMSSAWLLETDMEDTGFMNYDQMGKLSDKIDNLGVDLFYSEDLTFMDQSSQSQNGGIELPKVQEMCNNINISPPTLEPLLATSLPSSNTFTISFGDLNPKEEIFLELHGSLGYKAADSTKIPTIVRNPIQAQDHVLAERKRREKLNQHLISLSGLLPNRKKMGKASVLEDACNYIKELQGRVKELEELSGSKRKNVQESITSIKRLSLTEAKSDGSTEPWIVSPEIEVRMSGKSVLVRIQCQEKTSSLVKALTQMEKLGLSIISSNAMPFAKTTLLINIVAQIRDEFRITSTELVKHLQLTLVKPDQL